jgi:hypothetical protein
MMSERSSCEIINNAMRNGLEQTGFSVAGQRCGCFSEQRVFVVCLDLLIAIV